MLLESLSVKLDARVQYVVFEEEGAGEMKFDRREWGNTHRIGKLFEFFEVAFMDLVGLDRDVPRLCRRWHQGNSEEARKKGWTSCRCSLHISWGPISWLVRRVVLI